MHLARPTKRILNVALSALLLVALWHVTPTRAGSKASGGLSSKGFGPGIEAFPSYDGQDTCSPSAKPGVLEFRSLVLAAFPYTGIGGIERDCGVGGQSEHKEGRAWDWMVNAAIPEERAAADAVFAWLEATDRFGNDAAMARRVGIMYVIFDRQIWFPGSGWRVYCKQKDFGCHTPGDKKSLRHPHTDHVHFSFTWDGALGRTTFWKKKRSLLSGAAAPDGGIGYWLLARTGGVAAVGPHHHGSKLGSRKAATGLAPTPDGYGYWLVTSNGRVSAFGTARHLGGANGKSGKIVAIEPSPSGKGYWLLARRGRVFAFGDAPDLGGLASDEVATGLASSPSGQGYWIATREGVVHAFGDAGHLGDLAGRGEAEVGGIEGAPLANGYRLFTASGKVFAYGDLAHPGDLGSKQLTQKIVAMATTPTGDGYWLVGDKGKVAAFGDAPKTGSMRSLNSMHRPTSPPQGFSPLD